SVGYYEAYYLQAQRVRRLIRDEFLAAFGQVDAILAPTTPGPAFALGEKVDDPVAMYQQDVFTIPANLAGIPALSMPAGMTGGLPLGVQLLGPHFGEATLLNLAHAFQQATEHHLERPGGVRE
ncbi:MAG: Asp-tRNA(Asn)/Glu-tRNA(Gln) amidotransferase GatCAB subunit A, partial [Gammaproteobacteria bacterium]